MLCVRACYSSGSSQENESTQVILIERIYSKELIKQLLIGQKKQEENTEVTVLAQRQSLQEEAGSPRPGRTKLLGSPGSGSWDGDPRK